MHQVLARQAGQPADDLAVELAPGVMWGHGEAVVGPGSAAAVMWLLRGAAGGAFQCANSVLQSSSGKHKVDHESTCVPSHSTVEYLVPRHSHQPPHGSVGCVDGAPCAEERLWQALPHAREHRPLTTEGEVWTGVVKWGGG